MKELTGSNWSVISFTYIRFTRAMRAQGIDRDEYLPVKSRWAPYQGYWAFFWAFLFLWVQGYSVFVSGNWDVPTFIFNYGIVSFLPRVLGIPLQQPLPCRIVLHVPILVTLSLLT